MVCVCVCACAHVGMHTGEGVGRDVREDMEPRRCQVQNTSIRHQKILNTPALTSPRIKASSGDSVSSIRRVRLVHGLTLEPSFVGAPRLNGRAKGGEDLGGEVTGGPGRVWDPLGRMQRPGNSFMALPQVAMSCLSVKMVTVSASGQPAS